jgi:hypothetical protein
MLNLYFKNVLGFSKKVKKGILQSPKFKFENYNFIKFSKIYFSEDKKNQGKEKNKNEKSKEKGGSLEKVPVKVPAPVDKKEKSDKKKSLEQVQAQKNEDQESSESEESEDEEDMYKEPKEDEEEFIEYADKIKELLKPKQPLKNETYKIVHHHEKAQNKTRVNKKSLENLVTTLLRNEEITQKRAEEIKVELRDPLNNAYGRHLTKIKTRGDLFNYIQNFSDLYFYNVTFKNMDRIIRYNRELRDMKDPAFIQVRSQHKLVKNEDMQYLVPETTDVRQNVNSPDWLKEQPRMYSVGYNYNSEHYREFHSKFQKYVDEDKQKVLERKKLWKYVKLNPNDHQVRTRFLPKLLPDGVTPDMIPDYDVDITGFRPKVTKKSRRKYNAPRVDTDFKNYECWRCFDRVFSAFSHQYTCVRVNLIPKNLIAVRT